MNDNGDNKIESQGAAQSESKVIFSASGDKHGVRVTIAPGIPLEKLTLAFTILRLQIDNILIALNQRNNKPGEVPTNVLDKMRRGMKL